MENILRTELDSLSQQYAIIKDLLSRVESSFDVVQKKLQSLKDDLSKVGLRIVFHMLKARILATAREISTI